MTAKRGNCPRCGHKMWYSAKHRESKCAKCGYRIRFNAVIEIP